MGNVGFDDIMREQKVPVIAIDHKGIIFYVNDYFEKEFGWTSKDLLGNLITIIMPPYMRDAHNLGFSRFLVTESPRILHKPLSLPVYCRDKRIRQAKHFIVAEKKDGNWQFAAIVRPLKNR